MARTGIPMDEDDSDIPPICFFSRSELQKKERRRRQKGGQEVVRLLIYISFIYRQSIAEARLYYPPPLVSWFGFLTRQFILTRVRLVRTTK